MIFEHPPSIVARLSHDGRLDFSARTFFYVRLQQGFHLSSHLRLDFFLQLMAQITLGGFEFMLLPFGGGFGLHAHFRQCPGLSFGS